MRPAWRNFAFGLAFAASLFSVVLAYAQDTAAAPAVVRIKLIAFNDFHGHIEAPHISIRAPDFNDPSRDVLVPAGGAAQMATLVRQLRAQNSNNAVLSAGDLVGASPLTSSLFLDEPSIEVMNLIGVDFHAVGNHEFDKGVVELKRKQMGGCVLDAATKIITHLSPCQSGHAFAGAQFPFLAANVVETRTGKTLFAPYGIKTFDGVKVAFIGLTLKGTPAISTPANVRGYAFRDEAKTINALIPELKAQGVQVYVVVIHQGGAMVGRLNDTRCLDLNGPILDIIDQLDPAISVVISGHTHQAYVCDYKGVLLTSAGSYSRLLTDIDLEVDRASGKVLSKSALNRIVVSDPYDNVTMPAGYTALDKDPAVDQLVQAYAARVKPLAERQVGSVTQALTQATNAAGESSLGQVIADAQLAATRNAGAQIAFTNPGGIRTALDYGKDGLVTYADLFASQPFNNLLMTLTMTGAQIKAVLEQQFSERRQRPLILQVSQGFRYAYDLQRPAGERVIAESIRLQGRVLDVARTYRVTVNDYLAAGGDGFSIFSQAAIKGAEGIEGATHGMLDVDALEAWFQSRSPVAPGSLDRIEKRN